MQGMSPACLIYVTTEPFMFKVRFRNTFISRESYALNKAWRQF